MGGRTKEKQTRIMRIYIQNVRTGEFYNGEGQWSADEKKAFAFPSGLSALNFCQTLPKELEVIMRFGTPTEHRGLRVTEDTLRC